MMNKKMMALAALFLSLPQGAVALQCVPTTVSQDYWWHQESEETFVLVHGAFSGLDLREAAETSYGDEEMRPGRAVYSARFEGFLPSQRAFDQPFATDVTLVFPDYSHIGGGSDTARAAETLPGQVGLVWLMQTDQGYEVTHGICSGIIDTDPASVKPALRCLRGGFCPKG